MSVPERLLSRGDVVLVRFPFTDLSSDRVRPGVIVGRISGDDLLLAFVTSRVGPLNTPADCLLQPADSEFAATGLRVASIVRLDKLVTLHRGLVRRRLGRVGPQTAQRIANALRYVFEL